MRRPNQASPTDGVAGRALVDRLAGESGSDVPGAITKQRNRRDVLIHTRRYTPPGRDVNHLGTQGVAAEHLAGVRAILGHELDVAGHVVGAGVDSDVGRVVDPVHPDRLTRFAAQRIDERVADGTDAGWLVSAPSENHFGTR